MHQIINLQSTSSKNDRISRRNRRNYNYSWRLPYAVLRNRQNKESKRAALSSTFPWSSFSYLNSRTRCVSNSMMTDKSSSFSCTPSMPSRSQVSRTDVHFNLAFWVLALVRGHSLSLLFPTLHHLSFWPPALQTVVPALNAKTVALQTLTHRLL